MIEFDFNPVSAETYTITHSTPDLIEGEMWLGKGNVGPPILTFCGMEHSYNFF